MTNEHRYSNIIAELSKVLSFKEIKNVSLNKIKENVFKTLFSSYNENNYFVNSKGKRIPLNLLHIHAGYRGDDIHLFIISDEFILMTTTNEAGIKFQRLRVS